MPYKEYSVKKIYFSIGDVSERFNVSTSLIRFYEKEFEQLRPKKSTKGSRLFTEADITLIGKIIDLVKNQGYTLQGAKDSLKNLHHTESFDKKELVTTLNDMKKFLLQVRNNL